MGIPCACNTTKTSVADIGYFSPEKPVNEQVPVPPLAWQVVARMIEVLRTNNPIRLDYAVVLLTRAGCKPFVADRFISSVEGGISAFERRILVPDEHERRAKQALEELDRPVADEPDSDPDDDPA